MLGEDRFPVDVKELALEVSRNREDPITTVKGVDIVGFEGMLRARRKRPGWQILGDVPNFVELLRATLPG